MIPIIDDFEDGNYTENPKWERRYYPAERYTVSSRSAYTGNFGLSIYSRIYDIYGPVTLGTPTVQPHTPVTYTAHIKPFNTVGETGGGDTRYYFGYGYDNPYFGISLYYAKLLEEKGATVRFSFLKSSVHYVFYETTNGDFWLNKWLLCSIYYDPIRLKAQVSVKCEGHNITSPVYDVTRNKPTYCYISHRASYFSYSTAHFDNVSYSAEQERTDRVGTSYVRLPYGLISIRSDSDSVYSFVKRICEVTDEEYHIKYINDKISFNLGLAGTDKSQKITLTKTNPSTVYYLGVESYPNKLANYIRALGAGDGTAQLESHAFHATSDRTYLLDDFTGDDNILIVKSTYGFPNKGFLWVGCEMVSYSGKTANTFLNVKRKNVFMGNVKAPYNHRIYSPVVNAAYTPTSPQSTGLGSSIYFNGLIQAVFEDPSIYDQSLLDIKAERVLLRSCGVLT